MKITRLEIADYQQFKDFAIDLTYPAGHPKAGEPLDKICLIGQSGTGKTTILNIFKDFLNKFFTDLDNIGSIVNEKIKMTIYNVGFSFLDTNHVVKKSINIYDFKSVERHSFVSLKNFTTNHISQRPNFIYIPAELIEKVNSDFIQQHEANSIAIKRIISKNDEAITHSNLQLKRNLEKKMFYDFSIDSLLDIWKLIVFDSKEYFYELNKLSGLVGVAQLSKNFESVKKLTVEFEKIYHDDTNIVKKLSNMLNSIIKKFNIEHTLYIDYNNLEDLQFIKIQTLTGNIIPFQNWSTGTKQIALTSTPLIKINTKDTVILFDEPERSLYPDIQRVIIKHYTDLAPEAQFFFATHSPLIASQFEPWEIVELKFNEEGKVYRELYYEGENHVDNYTIFPQYLSWGEILTSVFDLNYDGNSDFRIELLTKTVRLKKQLAKMEQEGKRGTPEYNAKMDKFIKDAQKLGWSKELRTFYEEN